MNTLKMKQPNAIVVIYNYNDRLGDFKLSENQKQLFEVEQIILNSLSLKSVSTQKSKSNPAGAFEFRLAPLKNWVTAITPGSWCVILMSNSKLNDAAKYGGGVVDEKSFKMMGRIESVRGVTNTNQTTGAMETEYIVTGADWGTIFNSKFYVDVLNRVPNESAVGMAERFGYTKYLLDNIGYDASTLGGNANTKAAAGAIKKATTDASKGSVNRTADFLQGGSKQAATAPLDPVEDAQSTTTAQVAKDTKVTLPSAINNVDFILSLWGQGDTATSNIKNESGLVAKSQQIFKIPNQLAKYMGFIDGKSEVSPIISQILKQTGGKLTAPDTYANKDDSCGIIDFSTILGEHTIWQIITSNSNELINELIPEIRFESNKPTLTLYNRVRPFAVNDLTIIKRDTNAVGDKGIGVKAGEDGQETTQKSKVDPYISQFKHIRKKRIPTEDVIMCSYGTNWRDRVNFIEVTIARTLFQESYAADIKLDSQFVDESSISRDGLLSLLAQTTYVPAESGVANPIGVSAYKHALKEWYFNTHKMLNGTLNLIGQDQYIQVGDNIMVESKVLNKNYNINASQKSSPSKTYMLAHVESISHQTVVDDRGSRIFTTSINFVRGIITDINGNIVVADKHVGAMDQDASLVTPSMERHRETISTSSPMDPDRQRYPLKRGDPDFDGE